MNNLQLKDRRIRQKDPTDPEVMEREFWAFLDKEKAKSMFTILISVHHKLHLYHLPTSSYDPDIRSLALSNVQYHFGQ